MFVSFVVWSGIIMQVTQVMLNPQLNSSCSTLWQHARSLNASTATPRDGVKRGKVFNALATEQLLWMLPQVWHILNSIELEVFKRRQAMQLTAASRVRAEREWE